MHTGPVDNSAGTRSPASPTDVKCRGCGRTGHVMVETWDSSDGAFEDERYECTACGRSWWVDGIDS